MVLPKGYKYSKESRMKMSLANIGKPKSVAQRKKLSIIRKGKHNSPRTEFKTGCISPMKGRQHTELAKEKNRLKHIGKKHTKEWLENKRKWMIEKWNNPEFRKKMTEKRIGNKNWINSRYFIFPNKFERNAGIFLNKTFPNMKFRYVGNGKLIINGRNPDFINYENRIVVLANGIYWHLHKHRIERNRPDLEKWEVELEERKPYEEVGYKVMFIWEDEIFDAEVLAIKTKRQIS